MPVTGAKEEGPKAAGEKEGRVLPARTASLKKYFRELFTANDPAAGRTYTVLDVAPVNKHEIYLAIEEEGPAQSKKAEDAKDRRVFARLLCLPTTGEDAATTAPPEYRVEEESDPPTLTNCPLRILNLLTPTADVNTLRWRLECYEKQIAEARTALAETKAKYAAVEYDVFRDYVRKSGEVMVERRFLILHQALSAAQTTKALLSLPQQQ